MEIYMQICPKCGDTGAGYPKNTCTICGHSVITTDTTFDEHCFEFNNVQRQEWLKEITEKYVKSSSEFSEQAMSKRFDIEAKERYAEQHKIKCPTCSSANVSPISGLERGASVFALGLFSKKINKSFKCKNCGMTW